MFGNYKFNSLLKHPGYNKGKGGGGGGGSTTATTYTTNIPEYAKPYVNTMLGTAQQQIYNTDASGNVTSFRPYVPYSENPQDFIAPMSPLQMQSYYGAGEMQVPGQYGAGSDFATMSGLGSMGVAGQAARAGQDYYGMATNPYATQAFMSPYINAALTPQLEEMQRQYGISGTQQQSNATRAGAFGGSREALMAAENQRNKNIAMNQAIGTGYDKAFQAAQQAQQFGAGLGLQGQQAALSGLGQVGQAGATLGNLGTAQLGAQQGILNTQNLYGQQLQQQQQNIINQAIQTYANQQQYPMQQLANMSNLLRGLPMQSGSTQSYQAPPSPLATAAGLGTGVAGIASLMKAEGGIVKGYAGGGITSLENRQRIAETLNPQQLQTSIQNKTIPMRVGEAILEDNANMQQRAPMGMGIEGANSNIAPAFAEGGIVAFAGGDIVEYEPPVGYDAEEMYRQQRNALGAYGVSQKYGVPLDKEAQKRAASIKSPYDAALSYYSGVAQKGNPVEANAAEDALSKLVERRNAWMKGQSDPITGQPPTGSAIAAQPAGAAPAATKDSGLSIVDRIEDRPTYNRAAVSGYQSDVNKAFAQGRKDIEALKGYKGEYADELQGVLGAQRADINKPEMTREEADKIAGRAYEGSPYSDYEKTIRGRGEQYATDKEHALGRGLLAMSEQLLSNPSLATGVGKGLGEFGKIYASELKDIKAAQRLDEKALADIEQAKRLEKQGMYKDSEQLFQRAQDRRDSARDKLATTLSNVNAQDLNRVIQTTKAGVDLATDQAKTNATIGLKQQEMASNEALYREGLKGTRGAGMKGDWTNQQLQELRTSLMPEAEKQLKNSPAYQKLSDSMKAKNPDAIDDLREEILRKLMRKNMDAVLQSRTGGTSSDNTIPYSSVTANINALKPFMNM